MWRGLEVCGAFRGGAECLGGGEVETTRSSFTNSRKNSTYPKPISTVCLRTPKNMFFPVRAIRGLLFLLYLFVFVFWGES